MALNNIPYLELGENTKLLAPAYFITPWRSDQPGVRPIPESNLGTLKDARRRLQIIQERMTQLVKEEIQTSGLKRRFRQARLKLGKNHLGADIAAGDLVLIGLPNQPPEICFVENAEARDVTLPRSGGKLLQLPAGHCTNITPFAHGPKMASREGQTFTHFISMECTPNTAWDVFREKVEALQEDAALVFPMGKKIKVTSMHLTIATLLLKEDKVQRCRTSSQS